MTQLEVIRAFIRGEPARMNNIKSTGKELIVGQTIVSARQHLPNAGTVRFVHSASGNPCGMVWNIINRTRRQLGKLTGRAYDAIKFAADNSNSFATFSDEVDLVDIQQPQGVTT
jgi:hypothetical protein